MKKLTFIFVIGFLLVGCTSKVIITPDKLPDAVVGEQYYAEIEINGGSGPVSGGLKRDITSDYIWVEPNPKKEGRFYNSLIIHGIPKTTEDIIVKIQGEMIPTLFLGSAKFEKTYVIKVKEAE